MSNQDRHSYVQFYPSDWLGGMAYMPPMAEWLYLQICLYNWDKRAPLPAAEAKLRLSRSPDWEHDLAALLEANKVFKTAGGGLFVERAMVEAERAYELWEKKSRGGRVSTSKRNQREAQHSRKTVGNTPPGTLPSNESESESETSPNGEGAGERVGNLLFSVEPSTMANFRQHRMRLKAPLTPHAESLIVRKLERFHAEHGHDPTEVLNQSMERGWKGVFELKGDDHGNGNNGGSNGLLDACRER